VVVEKVVWSRKWWSLELGGRRWWVPLYLWSSKTDCGQASAWSLALNFKRAGDEGLAGVAFPSDTMQSISYCCAGREIRQDKKSRQRLVNGPASSGLSSGFVNPPPPDAATLES
jgi:hypothetical protein